MVESAGVVLMCVVSAHITTSIRFFQYNIQVYSHCIVPTAQHFLQEACDNISMFREARRLSTTARRKGIPG